MRGAWVQSLVRELRPPHTTTQDPAQTKHIFLKSRFKVPHEKSRDLATPGLEFDTATSAAVEWWPPSPGGTPFSTLPQSPPLPIALYLAWYSYVLPLAGLWRVWVCGSSEGGKIVRPWLDASLTLPWLYILVFNSSSWWPWGDQFFSLDRKERKRGREKERKEEVRK